MEGSGIARLRLAMAVLAAAAAVLVAGQKHLVAEPGPGLVLVLAGALPFAVAARWPQLLRPGWPLAAALLVVAGSAAGLLFYRAADGDGAVLFFIALAAWVGGAVGPEVSVPAGVVIVVLPLAAGALGGSHTPVTAAIGAGFAWVAGTAVRAQARTAAELVTAQAAAARHQITAERQQLAREFHDLVGHTLSVTMLHMSAVRLSLEDGETGEALESLDQAQRAGREAMREMRQTVTLLGSAPGNGPPAALPHVRDLPELAAGYAAAGLKVDVDVDADLAAVPGDVGLAAYRIAQESLNNAARHAPGSPARVQVRATAAELQVTVTNDISSPASALPPSPGCGHGIAGMTQRARLAGGAFWAGPDGAQWRVEAVLPLRDRQ
ncbi:MAG TPA: histidine kinase [Streptosporangiaceae bacterium]|nr:histidine kinase [Streptosporangiaceae bacterium]